MTTAIATTPELDDAPAPLPPLPTRRELRKMAATMGREEARYLVDLYYELQHYRISTANQVKALDRSGEPHVAVAWVLTAVEGIERDIKAAMAAFADSDPLATWAQEIVGIGPVLASGLAANFDITRAPTVGHWWSFAGVNPTQTWNKGEKRPYSAKAKTLLWRIGQSFVITSGNPNSYYGPLYGQRKAYESAKNEKGDYADQATARLTRQRIVSPELRACLAAGKLPPAALDARARRWTVKLFLAHFHAEAYRQHYGTEAPLPYPIAHLGHAHVIPAPAPRPARAPRGGRRKP